MNYDRVGNTEERSFALGVKYASSEEECCANIRVLTSSAYLTRLLPNAAKLALDPVHDPAAADSVYEFVWLLKVARFTHALS